MTGMVMVATKPTQLMSMKTRKTISQIYCWKSRVNRRMMFNKISLIMSV